MDTPYTHTHTHTHTRTFARQESGVLQRLLGFLDYGSEFVHYFMLGGLLSEEDLQTETQRQTQAMKNLADAELKKGVCARVCVRVCVYACLCVVCMCGWERVDV